MIDNISLKLWFTDNSHEYEQLLPERLQDCCWKDTNSYGGHLRNMKVYRNLDGITIWGSLAKYYFGENLTQLTLPQVREAVAMLETEMGVELAAAIVKSVEIGVSITVADKPAEYLKLFGNPGRFSRHEYTKAAGVETVTYSTRTGSFQFAVYDKVKEMQAKHQTLPPAEGTNVLRLEYRIVRRRGIKAKFRRDLTAYDLFHLDVYRKLQSLFVEKYQAIPKFGRKFYLGGAGNITPSKWTELLAEQYRHAFPKECRDLLQTLRESGRVSAKSLERIRAANRRRDREYTLMDKGPLIAELDNHILSITANLQEPVKAEQMENHVCG